MRVLKWVHRAKGTNLIACDNSGLRRWLDLPGCRPISYPRSIVYYCRGNHPHVHRNSVSAGCRLWVPGRVGGRPVVWSGWWFGDIFFLGSVDDT